MKTKVTSEMVEKLRKDFLLLMKNLERVKDYESAMTLQRVFRTYADHINEVVYRGLVQEIEGKNKNDWWAQRIRKDVWQFYIQLRLPIDHAREPGDEVYQWFTPSRNYEKFLSSKDKWIAKVKTEARKAWTALREFFESKGGSFEAQMPSQYTIEMSGFKVVVIGNSEHEDQYLRKIQETFRYFKSRALKVYPPLASGILPFQLNLHDQEGLGESAAATYDLPNRVIHLSPWVAVENLKHGAKDLAHEMGHHIYETYLSDSDQALWEHVIRGDKSPLDLREVLAVWPENASRYWIDGSPLRETDPTLYLQIYTAMFPPNRDMTYFTTREDVEALIAQGTTHIPLSRHPITVYASKNPEEAFCEALGMLVGYGPRAVDPVVLEWIHRILPNVRIASPSRVAARYEVRF
jgi:hypothetical protein